MSSKQPLEIVHAATN